MVGNGAEASQGIDDALTSLRPIEQLEEYSANHPETIDELINWDDNRFQAAWKAYCRRRQLTTIEWDHRLLVAALHANGNMESKAMEEALKSASDQMQQAREIVLEVDRPAVDKVSEEFVSYDWWKKPPLGTA